MAQKKILYSEPAEYFPRIIRKKLKIGEYAPKTERPSRADPEQPRKTNKNAHKGDAP